MSGSVPSNFVSVNGIGAVTDANLNTLAQVDPTATALRGFIGMTNMAVLLLGITAPGDGNGGVFYWANGTGYVDDNLDTIVPYGATDQGAWLRCGLL